MKKVLLCLGFFATVFLSLQTRAQNVDLWVEVVTVSRNSYSDPGLGCPDPTWYVSGYTGGYSTAGLQINQTFREHKEGDCGTSFGPYNYQIISHTNTDANEVNINFDAWEDNCFNWFGLNGDEWTFQSNGWCITRDNKRCRGNPLTKIFFRDDAGEVPCNWTSYTISCGEFSTVVRIYWQWATAPTITTQPAANTSLCVGTATSLSVATNSVSGHTLGRFFQWQTSTNTDCNTPGSWNDISGATSSSYTPPQTRGTRLYRVKVTSNCTASFGNLTTYSNCAKVTYHIMQSPGDPSPAIVSSICGGSVLPGSTNTLGTLSPPSPGAVTNLSLFTWTATPGTNASAGTFPDGNSGSAFSQVRWVAPATTGTVNIVVTYTPSLTSGPSCGTYASTTCVVNVTSPSCGDYVYVSPAAGVGGVGPFGNDGSGNGTPDKPFATLYKAMTTPNVKYIRMREGSYQENNVINIVSNVTVEGKYRVDNGNWIKDASKETYLNFPQSFYTIGGDICHRMALSANNVTGWTLMDLKIETQSLTTEKSATGTMGCSNYAIWLNNTSSYNIIRCKIINGNASSGLKGPDGAAGANGNNGYNGGTGHRDGGNGGGGSAVGGPGTGNRQGGTGGRGGDGGQDDNGGQGGSAGGAGGGGNGPDTSPGWGGSDHGCSQGDDGGWASAGVWASEAQTGTAGTPGTYNGTNYTFSTYFTPAQANAGTAGYGGGGGAGGGGGGGQGGTFCNDGGGAGGGGGGSGGEGGLPAGGGYGGGATFGIYRNSNATSGANITQVNVTSGGAGGGGVGGTGGSGGGGGYGGYGGGIDGGGWLPSWNGHEVGYGGLGSRGGNGGKGGDGANGAPGVTYNMYTVGTGPATYNQTIPTYALNVAANNQLYCRNSQIQLNKANLSDAWSVPTLTLVKNKTASTTDYTLSGTGSNPIFVYTATEGSVHNITAGGNLFENAIKISDKTRNQPVVNGGNPYYICYQGTITLSATTWYEVSSSEVAEYEWRIYPGDNYNSSIFTSPLKSPTTPSLPVGTYTIRYAERHTCCGWSIPAYSSVTVQPELKLGTLDNSGKVICYNTQPDNAVTIGFTTAPTGSGGFSYEWRKKLGSDCPPFGDKTGWSLISGQTGNSLSASVLGTLTQTTTVACWVTPNSGSPATVTCGSGGWAAGCYVVTVMPVFNAGSVIDGDQTICDGGTPAPMSLFPASQGSAFNYQWFYNAGHYSPSTAWPTDTPACPTGSDSTLTDWILIPGATGAVYTPNYAPNGLNIRDDSLYNTPLNLYAGYAVFVTPVASGGIPACGTKQWASKCRVVSIFDGQFSVGEISGFNCAAYPGCDDDRNIWVRAACYNLPSNLNLNVTPSPPTTCDFDWQISTDYDSLTDNGTWVTVKTDAGVNTSTYSPPAFTQSTFVRVLATPTSGGCAEPQEALNKIFFSMLPPFQVNDITGDSSAVQCYGYDVPELTAHPQGALGYYYWWQTSTDNTNWTTQREGQDGSYNTWNPSTPLTVPTYIRVRVSTGSSFPGCYQDGREPKLYSNTIFINVLPEFVTGNITPNATSTQCLRYDPQALSIFPTGGTGAYAYQWQFSIDGTNWFDISGAASSTYDHGTKLTETTHFRVVVTSVGAPCAAKVSNNTIVFTIAQSEPAEAGTSNTVCSTEYTFSANTPTPPGNGLWTRISGSGTFASGQEVIPNGKVTGLAPGDNVFEWKITTTACPVTTSLITIHRDEEPTQPDAGDNVVLCNDNFFYLDGNSPTVGVATWTRAFGSGDIVDIHDPLSRVNNMASGLSQFVWTIETNDFCSDKQDAMNVTTSIFPVMTWIGAVSTNWNDPLNWGCDIIPGIDNVVIIPNVANGGSGNFPVLKNSYRGICKDIHVEQFAKIEISPNAKFGVNKRFVWCDAGRDTTVCNNTTQSFGIGNQVVAGAELFTTYSWSPSTFLNNPNIAEPTVTVGYNTTVSTVQYVLTATNNTDPTDIYRDTVVLTINSAPKTFAGRDTFFCSTPVLIGDTIWSSSYDYLWSPTSGLSDPDSSAPEASPLTVTDYVLKETNTLTGCTRKDTITVSLNPVTAGITPSPANTCTGDDLIITASGNNGVAPHTYSWSTGATTAAITVNQATAGVYAYSVTVTDASGNGCTATASINVTVNAKPTVTFSGLAGAYCVNSANATLTGNPAGGTFSGTGIVNTNEFSPATAGQGTFNITYTYTDGNNCTNSQTKSVTVYPLPVVTFTGLAAEYCVSVSAVTLTGYANGSPTGTGYYICSCSNGLTDNNNGTASFNPSLAGAGTYNITFYSSVNGCESSQTQSVTINPLPAASASNAGPYCVGNTIQLNSLPNSQTAYSWSGPQSFSASVQNPTRGSATTAFGGVYTVTVTDAEGCSATANTTVVVNALPIVRIDTMNNFSAGKEYCEDAGAFTVQGYVNGSSSGSGSFSCTCSSGLTDNNNGTASFAPAVAGDGTWDITYTNSVSGCSSNQKVTVTVHPLPTVSISGVNASYCSSVTSVTAQGVANSANATSGSFTCTCSSGLTDNSNGTATFNPSAAGTGTWSITFAYTDAEGCQNSGSVNVTVNGAPSPSVSYTETPSDGNHNGTICNGSSVDITASGGSSYSWSTGSTSATISVSPTSTTGYTVTVTSASGCTATTSATVTVNDVPSASWNLHPTGPFCGNTSQTYSVQSYPAGSTFTWAAPTGWGTATAGGGSGDDYATWTTGKAGGSYTVTATVTKNGCSVTLTQSSITVKAAYDNANALYWGERGNRADIEFPCGGAVWTWNSTYNFYSNKNAETISSTNYAAGAVILVPNLYTNSGSPALKVHGTGAANFGNVVPKSAFYGLPTGAGGSAPGVATSSSTGYANDKFQWDGNANGTNCCTSSPRSEFDVVNMFISPVSASNYPITGRPNTMKYCQVMDDDNTNGCDSTTLSSTAACVNMSGDNSTLAYPSWNPKPGSGGAVYNVWAPNSGTNWGCTNSATMEFVYFDDGSSNGWKNSINITTGSPPADAVSQQQLAPTETDDASYCVTTYGKGWRLPTDTEAGHQTDATGNAATAGFDYSYRSASGTIWTSSRCNTINSSRWKFSAAGTWNGSAISKVSGASSVRCVFNGGY